jgi:hypothetical protein
MGCRLTADQVRAELPWHRLVKLPEPQKRDRRNRRIPCGSPRGPDDMRALFTCIWPGSAECTHLVWPVIRTARLDIMG